VIEEPEDDEDDEEEEDEEQEDVRSICLPMNCCGLHS